MCLPVRKEEWSLWSVLGNSGYYVDIFRSDRADNDYLFHHVGTSMEITDSEGNKLPGEALEKFDKNVA